MSFKWKQSSGLSFDYVRKEIKDTKMAMNGDDKSKLGHFFSKCDVRGTIFNWN